MWQPIEEASIFLQEKKNSGDEMEEEDERKKQQPLGPPTAHKCMHGKITSAYVPFRRGDRRHTSPLSLYFLVHK